METNLYTTSGYYYGYILTLDFLPPLSPQHKKTNIFSPQKKVFHIKKLISYFYLINLELPVLIRSLKSSIFELG